MSKVCLDYVPEVEVGDYTIVHVGFAISKIDEETAEQTLADFRAMGVLDEELASEEEAFARAANGRNRIARMEAAAEEESESASQRAGKSAGRSKDAHEVSDRVSQRRDRADGWRGRSRRSPRGRGRSWRSAAGRRTPSSRTESTRCCRRASR